MTPTVAAGDRREPIEFNRVRAGGIYDRVCTDTRVEYECIVARACNCHRNRLGDCAVGAVGVVVSNGDVVRLSNGGGNRVGIEIEMPTGGVLTVGCRYSIDGEVPDIARAAIQRRDSDALGGCWTRVAERKCAAGEILLRRRIDHDRSAASIAGNRKRRTGIISGKLDVRGVMLSVANRQHAAGGGAGLAEMVDAAQPKVKKRGLSFGLQWCRLTIGISCRAIDRPARPV